MFGLTDVRMSYPISNSKKPLGASLRMSKTSRFSLIQVEILENLLYKNFLLSNLIKIELKNVLSQPLVFMDFSQSE